MRRAREFPAGILAPASAVDPFSDPDLELRDVQLLKLLLFFVFTPAIFSTGGTSPSLPSDDTLDRLELDRTDAGDEGGLHVREGEGSLIL